MYRVTHGWQDETPEAKARWFGALSLEERMDYLCAVTDLVLENNPRPKVVKNAEPPSGRIRVLTLTPG
jgi:hypothetical protein